MGPMRNAALALLLVTRCALAAPVKKCEELAGTSLGRDVKIEFAKLVAGAANLPEHCEVRGVIWPGIRSSTGPARPTSVGSCRATAEADIHESRPFRLTRRICRARASACTTRSRGRTGQPGRSRHTSAAIATTAEQRRTARLRVS